MGQHFLIDPKIAEKIISKISFHKNCQNILEIGPGTGMLTKILLRRKNIFLKAIEKDIESVHFLNYTLSHSHLEVIHGDFLRIDEKALFSTPYIIIGNFPYNISSQIFFRIYDQREHITEVVCTIQKEVAERLTSSVEGKKHGLLTILLKTFFDLHYEYTLSPNVFFPIPKVYSAVITLKRNERKKLDCNEDIFKHIIKAGFNHRRKTLRNALKSFALNRNISKIPILQKRAEQLSIIEFIELTHLLEKSKLAQCVK